MNLNDQIISAEERFKHILEEFFTGIYNESLLPSHGIDHHRRVWSYSKELLRLLDTDDKYLPSKLIIASFLHDIGMTIDPGIKHGLHSKVLCINFLESYGFNLSDYQDVIIAIENHDNKEYPDHTCKSDTLIILSVADDLDAYGFLGIYRYAEVYLRRGLDYKEIGQLIRKNASGRFANFEKTFANSEELIKKHRNRYLILDIFFNEYNERVHYYRFGEQNPEGYCGVMEILNSIIRKKVKIKDFSEIAVKYPNDPVICRFFKGLASESVI